MLFLVFIFCFMQKPSFIVFKIFHLPCFSSPQVVEECLCLVYFVTLNFDRQQTLFPFFLGEYFFNSFVAERRVQMFNFLANLCFVFCPILGIIISTNTRIVRPQLFFTIFVLLTIFLFKLTNFSLLTIPQGLWLFSLTK